MIEFSKFFRPGSESFWKERRFVFMADSPERPGSSQDSKGEQFKSELELIFTGLERQKQGSAETLKRGVDELLKKRGEEIEHYAIRYYADIQDAAEKTGTDIKVGSLRPLLPVTQNDLFLVALAYARTGSEKLGVLEAFSRTQSTTGERTRETGSTRVSQIMETEGSKEIRAQLQKLEAEIKELRARYSGFSVREKQGRDAKAVARSMYAKEHEMQTLSSNYRLLTSTSYTPDRAGAGGHEHVEEVDLTDARAIAKRIAELEFRRTALLRRDKTKAELEYREIRRLKAALERLGMTYKNLVQEHNVRVSKEQFGEHGERLAEIRGRLGIDPEHKAASKKSTTQGDRELAKFHQNPGQYTLAYDQRQTIARGLRSIEDRMDRIGEAAGVNSEQITAFRYAGFTRIPRYKEDLPAYRSERDRRVGREEADRRSGEIARGPAPASRLSPERQKYYAREQKKLDDRLARLDAETANKARARSGELYEPSKEALQAVRTAQEREHAMETKSRIESKRNILYSVIDKPEYATDARVIKLKQVLKNMHVDVEADTGVGVFHGKIWFNEKSDADLLSGLINSKKGMTVYSHAESKKIEISEEYETSKSGSENRNIFVFKADAGHIFELLNSFLKDFDAERAAKAAVSSRSTQSTETPTPVVSPSPENAQPAAEPKPAEAPITSPTKGLEKKSDAIGTRIEQLALKDYANVLNGLRGKPRISDNIINALIEKLEGVESAKDKKASFNDIELHIRQLKKLAAAPENDWSALEGGLGEFDFGYGANNEKYRNPYVYGYFNNKLYKYAPPVYEMVNTSSCCYCACYLPRNKVKEGKMFSLDALTGKWEASDIRNIGDIENWYNQSVITPEKKAEIDNDSNENTRKSFTGTFLEMHLRGENIEREDWRKHIEGSEEVGRVGRAVAEGASASSSARRLETSKLAASTTKGPEKKPDGASAGKTTSTPASPTQAPASAPPVSVTSPLPEQPASTATGNTGGSNLFDVRNLDEVVPVPAELEQLEYATTKEELIAALNNFRDNYLSSHSDVSKDFTSAIDGVITGLLSEDSGTYDLNRIKRDIIDSIKPFFTENKETTAETATAEETILPPAPVGDETQSQSTTVESAEAGNEINLADVQHGQILDIDREKPIVLHDQYFDLMLKNGKLTVKLKGKDWERGNEKLREGGIFELNFDYSKVKNFNESEDDKIYNFFNIGNQEIGSVNVSKDDRLGFRSIFVNVGRKVQLNVLRFNEVAPSEDSSPPVAAESTDGDETSASGLPPVPLTGEVPEDSPDELIPLESAQNIDEFKRAYGKFASKNRNKEGFVEAAKQAAPFVVKISQDFSDAQSKRKILELLAPFTGK